MGGNSSSLNTVNIVKKTINEMIANSILSSENNTTMTQTISVTGGSNNRVEDVNFNQSYTLNLTMLQDSQQMANLQTQIADTIKQAADSAGVGITGLLSSAKSESNTYVEDTVKNAVTLNAITEAVANVVMIQAITLTNTSGTRVKGITASQTAAITQNIGQKVTNKIEAITTLQTAIDQKSSAKVAGPLDTLFETVGNVAGGFFKSITGGIIMLGLVAIVFILFGGDIAKVFTGASSTPAATSTSTPAPKAVK